MPLHERIPPLRVVGPVVGTGEASLAPQGLLVSLTGGLRRQGRTGAEAGGAAQARASGVVSLPIGLPARSAHFQGGQDHPFDGRGQAGPSVDQTDQVGVNAPFALLVTTPGTTPGGDGRRKLLVC